MWNVIICDDQPEICQQLCTFLDRFTEDCGIELHIQECHSGQELLESVSCDTDLILLDIKMDPMSGMDAARAIRQKNQDICIIFITTMTQYAMEGYQVHAFGFIKKPIHYAQLRIQLLDAARMLKNRHREFFTLRCGNQSYRLDLTRVLYLEVYGHDIHVHCTDESYLYYGSLSDIEKDLSQHEFFRCHKSYLINLRHVRQIQTSQVLLSNGFLVPVSKYRKKELQKSYFNYLGGQS